MTSRSSPFEALRLHDRALRALARGLLADGHAAEDLAQEAWLASLRSRGRPDSPGAWLAVVARNLAAKVRRGDERRAWRERASARTDGEPSPAEILEREAARARVVAAVLALEEPYRATVLLRYFEELPPRAIARRQGVPVETVRTRLRRALERLRARLDREFGERGAWAALLARMARAARSSTLDPLAETLSPLLAVTAMSTLAKIAGATAALVLIVVLVQGRRGARELPVEPPPEEPKLAALRPPPQETPAAIGAAPVVQREAVPAVEPGVAPLEGEPSGSLLVSVTWSDGTPAAGIHALVEPAWMTNNPSRKALDAVTGSDGTFVIDPLPVGRALVVLDRNDGGWTEVEAGEQATLAIQLERGFDVAGVVLDPAGSPVQGAEVWLSFSFTFDQGLVVARTGADGRFLLRGCTGGAIGARAARFAPSLLQSLRAGEGSTLELELVLMGPGGELSGRVFDAEGEPVRSAFVFVEPLGFKRRVVAVPVGGTRESSGMSAPAQEARTDESGRFTVAGLEPGVRKIAVRASEHALWRGEAEVFEHGSATLDVALVRGVSVEGRVVDAEGRPVRAEVSAEIDEDPMDPFTSVTRTDAQGFFRLEDLGPGEFEVLAETKQARAQATLRGAPGETIAWNPVLARGGVIRGRLVDEAGAAVAGHFVQYEDEPPWPADACGRISGARTDAEGRFVLEGLGNHPHRLEAHAPGVVLFPLAVASGVLPEREEVLLQIEAERRPSVWIAGTVLDANGLAVPNAQVRPRLKDFRYSQTFTTDAGGDFELGPYPHGTWSLEVRPPSGSELPPVTLGPQELAAGETWDCGAIVLAPR